MNLRHAVCERFNKFARVLNKFAKRGASKYRSLVIVERDVRLEVLQVGIDEQVDRNHSNNDCNLDGQRETPARSLFGQRADVVAAAARFFYPCRSPGRPWSKCHIHFGMNPAVYERLDL